MSHHMDTPEPQTNITDMYVFQKPGDPTKTIFILNVNPDAPRQATTFNPQASYELKIDTNGDAQADIAFHMLFAPAGDQQQTATVDRATGVAAEGAGRGRRGDHPPGAGVAWRRGADHDGGRVYVFRRPAQRPLLRRPGGLF